MYYNLITEDQSNLKGTNSVQVIYERSPSRVMEHYELYAEHGTIHFSFIRNYFLGVTNHILLLFDDGELQRNNIRKGFLMEIKIYNYSTGLLWVIFIYYYQIEVRMYV